MSRTQKAAFDLENMSVYFADKKAVDGVSLTLFKRCVTAIIGPDNGGKSSLLKSLNRLNDFNSNFKLEGLVSYRGQDLYAAEVDPLEVRTIIGMVFPQANLFPKTIFENVAWAPKINKLSGDVNVRVETALKKVGLWDELFDRLDEPALTLSPGQQQCLSIARCLAMEPEVILMDKPCSNLDLESAARIENLMFELKSEYTIVLVTRSLQQAARVSDFTAFMEQGSLVEFGETDQVFTRPKIKRTEEFVTGRFS